jgi:hypothetical protein
LRRKTINSMITKILWFIFTFVGVLCMRATTTVLSSEELVLWSPTQALLFRFEPQVVKSGMTDKMNDRTRAMVFSYDEPLTKFTKQIDTVMPLRLNPVFAFLVDQKRKLVLLSPYYTRSIVVIDVESGRPIKVWDASEIYKNLYQYRFGGASQEEWLRRAIMEKGVIKIFGGFLFDAEGRPTGKVAPDIVFDPSTFEMR